MESNSANSLRVKLQIFDSQVDCCYFWGGRIYIHMICHAGYKQTIVVFVDDTF